MQPVPLVPISTADQYNFQNWRSYEHSLTDKLQSKTKDIVRVSLLAQAWLAPSYWDRLCLALQERLLTREVLIHVGDVVYWYARSLIPEPCYKLDPIFFARLRQQSMRELIFNQDRVVCEGRFNYPVNAQCLEWHWANKYLALPELCWLRGAKYSFCQQQSFYVMELLLPSLAGLSDD